jgi:hypothetical protein
VGEFSLQLFGWDRPRRFVVIREQLRAERPSLGRKLLEVPGYTFRVLVTSLALPPEEIGRDYHRRSDRENRIAELKHDLAADDFCLQEFFATEAAFRTCCCSTCSGNFSALPAGPPIASRPRCALKGSSAERYSVARATVWFSICGLLGAACNGASRCWKIS